MCGSWPMPHRPTESTLRTPGALSDLAALASSGSHGGHVSGKTTNVWSDVRERKGSQQVQVVVGSDSEPVSLSQLSLSVMTD